jgi:dihydrodipicolinate synthase/N-acetylneuraminate lyase
MLAAKTAEGGQMVAVSDLAAGVALGSAATAPTLKTRTKEVGFQVMTGTAATMLESLEVGAAGSVLGFAACAPQACLDVYLAWKDHDLKLAAANQERIVKPSKRIVGQLGISGVKYACDFNGYYGGRSRAPLLGLTAEEKLEIEGLLGEIRS